MAYCALAGTCACTANNGRQCRACKNGIHGHGDHNTSGCHMLCRKPPGRPDRGRGPRPGAGARPGPPGSRGGCGCTTNCTACIDQRHQNCKSKPQCSRAEQDREQRSSKCKCKCTMCRKALPGCLTGRCTGQH